MFRCSWTGNWAAHSSYDGRAAADKIAQVQSINRADIQMENAVEIAGGLRVVGKDGVAASGASAGNGRAAPYAHEAAPASDQVCRGEAAGPRGDRAGGRVAGHGRQGPRARRNLQARTLRAPAVHGPGPGEDQGTPAPDVGRHREIGRTDDGRETRDGSQAVPQQRQLQYADVGRDAQCQRPHLEPIGRRSGCNHPRQRRLAGDGRHSEGRQHRVRDGLGHGRRGLYPSEGSAVRLVPGRYCGEVTRPELSTPCICHIHFRRRSHTFTDCVSTM